MSTPRRPASGRRPAPPGARPARTTARTPARAPARTPARSGPAAGTHPTSRTGTRAVPATEPPTVAGRKAERPRPPSRRGLLTGRAAVLALVLVGLLVSAALPLKEHLDQRGEIAALEQQQAATRERVAALQAERERLQDPAYVAAEARRRLHFVLPGETAYVVLVPDEPVVEPEPSGEAADEPWYSQVWGSVEEADRPSPAPAP